MRYTFCLISLMTCSQIQCMSDDPGWGRLTEHLRKADWDHSNTNDRQWNLLLCAIKDGNLAYVNTYATNNIVQQNQGTLLAAAASTKHPHTAPIIEKLIELGAQPNTPTIWTRMSCSSIQWSCQTIQHTSTNSLTPIVTYEERLPLDIALLAGNVEAVKALLHTGINPHETKINLGLPSKPGPFRKETPLYHAYLYKTALQKGGDREHVLSATYGLSATIVELNEIIELLFAKSCSPR